MAFTDLELFARIIQCEAGGEGDDIKEHTQKKPLEWAFAAARGIPIQSVSPAVQPLLAAFDGT